MTGGSDYTVGRGKPPKNTRFQRGQKHAPGKRRKKRVFRLPYGEVLDRTVSITEDGTKHEVSAEVAFLKRLVWHGFQSDGLLRKYALEVSEKARERKAVDKPYRIVFAVYAIIGDVRKPMRNVGMATLLRPTQPSAQIFIEPWLVEQALERFGDRALSLADQEIVVAATRKPHTVRWPAWWTAKDF